MNRPSTTITANASLADRLRNRAASTRPDKRPPVIMQIIPVRIVIAEQRDRGLSWEVLADLLAAEGVNLSPGTLRNYIALIAKSIASLRAVGNTSPSDVEIHAAVRDKTAPAVQIPEPGADAPRTHPPAPVHTVASPPRAGAATPAAPSMMRKPLQNL